MNTEELADIVENEFAFLQVKYGFGKLVIRNLSREVFFEFERVLETISISFEGGVAPIIEVFVPSTKTDEGPTPWAAKNGVPRSMIFPKISVKRRFEPLERGSVKTYFAEMAKEFKSSESGWLNA